jgi:carbonic anhydrase
MSVTDQLLRNNRHYAGSFTQGCPCPRPEGVAVVACMDARLDLHELLGLGRGDAVIRNAGGAITEDAIRSLGISQRLLGTREIILVPTRTAGCSVRRRDPQAGHQTETGIRPPFAFEPFPDLDEDVRQSLARERANPFIPHRGDVRGFVYDVRTGRLREVK